MSTVKKRIDELASAMGENQLEEVADFMAYLLRKDENLLREGMMQASQSGLAFWDSKEDEVWDHV